MVDQGLQTRGGAGGVTARYDDMLSNADGLDRVSGEVIGRADALRQVPANPDLLASAVLSPVTAAQVEEQVVAATLGPHGLLPTAAALKANAIRLRMAVQAYQAADTAVARVIGGRQALLAVPMLVGSASKELPRALADLETGKFDDLSRIPGLMGGDIMRTLYDDPWIVDGVVTDAPALLTGLSILIGPTATAALSVWTATREGSPFPPATLAQASADTVAIGEAFGLFLKGTPESSPLGGPHPATPFTDIPSSFASTMSGVGDLGHRPGTVRVFQVAGADGVRRWVVEIPGTQEWSPEAGTNPVDMTTNVRLMAGQQTMENQAIAAAMRQAGIQPGDPVMLAGHSQGGIAAASLASDPSFRKQFDVTNVYTGGAPIARFAIPPDVHVLSIEHTTDAVPRLDGMPNPDRPTWVTVTQDPTGMTQRDGAPVTSTGQAHDSFVYAKTAAMIDNSSDSGLMAIRQSFTPFFTSDRSQVIVQDFQLARQIP